jgi:hypothetical protein
MGAKTFSITALSITTLSITTLSIKGLSARVSIHGNRCNNTLLRVAVIIMLSIIMQSVVVLYKILRLGRLQSYSQLLELPQRMDMSLFVQSIIDDEKSFTTLNGVVSGLKPFSSALTLPANKLECFSKAILASQIIVSKTGAYPSEMFYVAPQHLV